MKTIGAFDFRDPRLPPRFWNKVKRAFRPDTPEGVSCICWEWQGALDRGGYSKTANGKGSATAAHRLAYATLAGRIPRNMHIDHLCRVRSCVNPAHLEPVTAAENNRRAADAHIGSVRPNRLHQEGADKVRAMHATGGLSIWDMAQLFGVTYETIVDALENRTWTGKKLGRPKRLDLLGFKSK